MVHQAFVLARKWRRLFSRSDWAIRILGLSSHKEKGSDDGLILLQIDGLSHTQFQAAMKEGRLPFLSRLMKREHYRLHLLYSGLPSNTPAAQAEFFYGEKSAVPAFSFFDRKKGVVRRMYEKGTASDCEAELGRKGEPLLKGGSAYSNVFTGGAEEAHFCASHVGWRSLLRAAAPHAFIFLLILYADMFVRAAALIVFETVLAVIDFLRGSFTGSHPWDELKFIPTRVSICVLLRELVTAGAEIDAARGLPVIHVNFLGYDEQAHRRGPASRFAHWSLGGIDSSIRRIWSAAHRSARRDYDVWIYSDHGQSSSDKYPAATGLSLMREMTKILGAASLDQDGADERGEREERAELLGFEPAPRAKRPAGQAPAEEETVRIAAMGPLGHVYAPRPLSGAEREIAAFRMAREAKIPLVFVLDAGGEAAAFTASGKFRLAQDARDIFGAGHRFAAEMSADLQNLMRHRDAGDFIISGYRGSHKKSISFQSEFGSHGGIHPDEASAFAFVPGHAPVAHEGPHLRHLDLRDAAFLFLGRAIKTAPAPRRALGPSFRLMTYNVHSCIGMDGRLSPERIARVIARHDPDIIALQEVEVRCARTGCVDQVEQIAKKLEMEFRFHPSFHVEEGTFGNAVLSRFPVRDFRSGPLPRMAAYRGEPRGVLSVLLDLGGFPLRIVNTHLSIWPQERRAQARVLCSEWIKTSDAPVVLCGDLNSHPGSRTYRIIEGVLRDAQKTLRHKPPNTWSGPYPVVRIDHVFLGDEVIALKAAVPRTALERRASDHLPLVMDLTMAPAG